jgi:hypothetical protein
VEGAYAGRDRNSCTGPEGQTPRHPALAETTHCTKHRRHCTAKLFPACELQPPPSSSDHPPAAPPARPYHFDSSHTFSPPNPRSLPQPRAPRGSAHHGAAAVPIRDGHSSQRLGRLGLLPQPPRMLRPPAHPLLGGTHVHRLRGPLRQLIRRQVRIIPPSVSPMCDHFFSRALPCAGGRPRQSALPAGVNRPALHR